MNKKIIVGVIVCAVICISVIIAVNLMETNKEDDLRTAQNESEAETMESNAESTSVENDNSESQTTDSADTKNKSLMIDSDIQIEFLSCNIIDDTDIADQTDYPAEYFYDGSLPDYNPDEPRKTYIFVNCIIKNVSDKVVDGCIDLYAFISSDESEYLGLREGLCYFDKAEHISGEDREHRFFWYNFDKGEELECVLGFEVREGKAGKEKEQYYIGIQPLNVVNFTLENTKGLIIPVSEIGD